MLISTIATLLVQIVLCVVALHQGTESSPEDDRVVPKILPKVLNYLTLMLCSICAIILGVLLGFHVYLIKHKMMTISYIKLKSNKRESKTVKKMNQAKNNKN